MAAGTLPAPGTKLGPCKPGPCQSLCVHKDCNSLRIAAESLCSRCGKPIGYETRYYDASGPAEVKLVHALCEEEAVEAERKK